MTRLNVKLPLARHLSLTSVASEFIASPARGRKGGGGPSCGLSVFSSSGVPRMERLMNACLLAMGIVAAIQSGPALAEPMGRLFLTPERRAVLDRERQLNISGQKATEEPLLSVDGIVKRSSGKNTIWINGRPNGEGNAVLAPRSSNQVILTQDSEPTGLTRLKPGEALNRESRKIISGLGTGKVIVGHGRSQD